MSLSVRCQCGKSYKVAESAAGKRVRCSACGSTVAVPAAKAAVARKPKAEAARAADEDSEFGSSLDDLPDEDDSGALPPRQLPPRAGAAASEERSGAPTKKLPSWVPTDSLEDRMRTRSNAAFQEAFDEYRMKQIAMGVVFLIMAGAAFWTVLAMQRSGRLENLPGSLAVLFSMFGKWGATILLAGFGSWKIYLGVSGRFFRDDRE